MITPVVESLKYLTALEYDILSYVLIHVLLTTDKPKFKADHIHVSQWLNSTSSFIGQVCKRHDMDMSGILQYLVLKLREDEVVDFVILKELIVKMTGVESIEGAGEAQIEAMAGRETLKKEGTPSFCHF